MLELPEGFITVQDISKKLNKDSSTILPLIHNGEFLMPISIHIIKDI